jgi:quinohemoprotein ethanol dehydrogenase
MKKIVLGAGIALLAAACAPAGAQAPTKTIKPTPAFTKQQLLEHPKDGWLTNGGNLYNQRYSPLTQINRENVKDLKAVWRVHLNGSGMGAQHSGQGQPLVYDGVIFQPTGENDVFALDVETGAILWSYQAKLDPARVKVCCGWMSRGVGLGDGRVYVGQLDAKLLALDQRTGKVLWEIQAENPLEGHAIASAPLYYDGMVIVGFAGGDMGVRGRIKAFDAKSGRLRWTFYTIPAPGEFGSDSWPSDNEVWKYGGAAIWQTPAIDPELGLVYFTTGNAAPAFNGSVRKGDNLFTVSMLALDVKTGKRRWHFQQVRHDIWDYDSPNPVVLFDAPYNGRMRKGIAEISKTAWVYILDRETGEPLIGMEDRPVPQEPRQHTAATQPYPIGDPLFPQMVDIAPEGYTLVNGGRIFTPFWDKVVFYRPQMAVNWPPSSYDPETNHFFVCGIDNLASSWTDGKSFEPPKFDGMWNGGGFLFTQVARRGVFAAFDLKTNRLVWSQQWPEGCWSGSIVTAGGLVFTGRSDGRFTALDKTTGYRLWQFQTDAGVNATASTFEYKGQQYIVVMSAGTLFGSGKKGDSLWLFSLDGKIESFPVQAAPRSFFDRETTEPEVADTREHADPKNGKELYTRFCLACHGNEGKGGHGGGASLAPVGTSPDQIAAIATTGKGDAMPPFRGVLKPAELRDIAAYITEELF